MKQVGALWGVVALAVLVVAPAGGVFPRAQGDLARAAQNPAASMVSLPFQPDSILGKGPDDDIQNVLKDDVIEPDNLPAGDSHQRLQVLLLFPKS